MSIWPYIIITIILGFLLAYVILYFLLKKIQYLEYKVISLFSSRTDILPWLYEITKLSLGRHEEIFSDVLSLRKKEFSLFWISKNLESFIELEQYIHHEINFIFQVCNKNQKLIKNKNFLYLRDVMIERSSKIGKEVRKYKKIVEVYNKAIKIKNYSIIWFILPFQKKATI